MAGAKRFEDLNAWKLSYELKERIFSAISEGSASKDRDFVDQILDSARSAPSNIAEGFGAYKPREFARLTRIARRSLMETKNHILEGRERAHFSPQLTTELQILCNRALGATTGLLRYLDACDGEAPSNWGE